MAASLPRPARRPQPSCRRSPANWRQPAPYSAERIMMLLALTALLCALFQLVYGYVHSGRLIKFIP
jgi:MFS superfamily sulfate permease-like transporter